MPEYRIELSPNNRAGCQIAACKKDGVKILKGEIRIGTWVMIQENSSWRYKHWGCVSGEQIKNIQDTIGKDEDGEYRWDYLDGWEELEDHPEVREKIQRVINQGHIDPEDFNGDPEMNVPGRRGIHLPKSKKTKPTSEDEAADNADEPGAEKPKKATSKGGRGKKAQPDTDDADEPEAEKPKKVTGKRARGKKVEADTDDADEPEPPAKKAKRAPKKESASEPKPEKPKAAAKGKRSAKKEAVVKEESDVELGAGSENMPEPTPTPEKPKRASRAKVGAKTAAAKNEDEEVAEPPKKKGGRAKKFKKEPSPEPESDGEPEPEGEPEEDQEEKPATRTRSGRKIVERKSVQAPKKRGKKSAA